MTTEADPRAPHPLDPLTVEEVRTATDVWRSDPRIPQDAIVHVATLFEPDKNELATHVAGTVLVSRLRWRTCSLDRGPRYAGKSKMNFVGLALHGFKGLMIFAEDVLVRVGIACALVALLSLLGGSAAIVLKAVGYATPGWFSIALGLLMLVFLQTGAITLMTLMLTGITRSSTVLALDYKLLVDRVLRTTDGTDHA